MRVEFYYWPNGEWCWPDDMGEKLSAPCALSDDFARAVIDIPENVNDDFEAYIDRWLVQGGFC